MRNASSKCRGSLLGGEDKNSHVDYNESFSEIIITESLQKASFEIKF